MLDNSLFLFFFLFCENHWFWFSHNILRIETVFFFTIKFPKMKTSITKHSQLTLDFKAICLNSDLTSHHLHKNSHFLHKKDDSHFMNVMCTLKHS
jgi:hypothetical protein